MVGVAQTIACCGQIGGIGCRCEITQRRVRSPLVVIVDPGRDLGPGMIEAEEQALVEKLVAHAAGIRGAFAPIGALCSLPPLDRGEMAARRATWSFIGMDRTEGG